MGQSQHHSYASPLRYPGGKGMLANFMKLIVSHNELLDGQYVELYAGGAGVAWQLLFQEYVTKVHINDLNKPLIAFWESVLEDTESLSRLIMDTPVEMETWFRQQEVQRHPQNHSRLDLGFSTFFLNRTNRSGILKGGVIGGKKQTGKWKIDARYNKKDLVQRIQRIARYRNRVQIYNLDAEKFIATVLPDLPHKTLIYLDPPYYNKGQRLYENHYIRKDHERIAHLISDIKQPWIVSYDGCSEVEELYKSYRNLHYHIGYSAQSRYSGSEYLFFSPKLLLPEVDDPKSVKTHLLYEKYLL